MQFFPEHYHKLWTSVYTMDLSSITALMTLHIQILCVVIILIHRAGNEASAHLPRGRIQVHYHRAINMSCYHLSSYHKTEALPELWVLHIWWGWHEVISGNKILKKQIATQKPFTAHQIVNLLRNREVFIFVKLLYCESCCFTYQSFTDICLEDGNIIIESTSGLEWQRGWLEQMKAPCRYSHEKMGATGPWTGFQIKRNGTKGMSSAGRWNTLARWDFLPVLSHISQAVRSRR